MRLYVAYTHDSEYCVENMRVFTDYYKAKEYLMGLWENEKERIGRYELVEDGTFFEDYSESGSAYGRVETEYSFTDYELMVTGVYVEEGRR